MPDTIVSLFVGGASVELALAKAGFNVVCYDVFSDLINFYNELKNNKEVLLSSLKQLKPTKQEYKKIKNELQQDFYFRYKNILKPPKTVQLKADFLPLSNLQQARDFYFNHNLSYGPAFLGWFSSNYANSKKYDNLLKRLASLDLSRMSFYCSDFATALNKHKDAFLYLDPPYYLSKNGTVFAGIYPQRNFPIFHDNFNHQQLAKQLKEQGNSFVLSYNDCAEIRALYEGWCKIIPVSWQYTMGQGETRIGKNRKEANKTNKKDFVPSNIKQSSEILIVRIKSDEN